MRLSFYRIQCTSIAAPWAFILAWIAFLLDPKACQAWDDNLIDFQFAENVIGAASSSGNFEKIVSLEPEIAFLEQSFKPIIHFSSKQDNAASSILGVGYWVPFFESSIILLEEQKIAFVSPLGGRIELFQDADGKYYSKCLKWKGVQDGNRFLLSSVDGRHALSFRNGLLENWSANNELLSWKRQKDAVTVYHASAGSEKKEMVANVELDDKGMAKCISFGNKQYKFKWGGFPILRGGKPVALTQSVTGVVDKSGRSLYDHFFQIMENGNLSLWQMENEKPGHLQAEWLENGSLVRDSSSHYAINSNSPYSKEYPKIERRYATGEIEHWYWDANRGLSNHRWPDGSLSEVAFILTPGPVYGKIRQSKFIDPNGILKIESYSFNKDGHPLKFINSSGVEHRFFSNAAIPSSHPPKANVIFHTLAPNGDLTSIQTSEYWIPFK
jgi:hypothetical protein